jgi:hypothetical protein
MRVNGGSMRFAVVPVLAPLLALSLGGCLARAAVDAVSLPVHAAGKVVDWSTTSQAESDRNRGRMMRKEEARMRKEQRKEERERRRHEREMRDDD